MRLYHWITANQTVAASTASQLLLAVAAVLVIAYVMIGALASSKNRDAATRLAFRREGER